MSKRKIMENIPGWWVVFRNGDLAEAWESIHHFPTGAEAIAAFAAGGR